VRVDPELGTICWPNGVEMDPLVLRYDQERLSAQSPLRLRAEHVRTAVVPRVVEEATDVETVHGNAPG